VKPAPEAVILEPLATGYSDRDLAVLAGGGVLGVVAIVLAVYFLPPGIVLLVVLLLAYPGVGLWKTIRRDRRARAPRLVLGPDALEVGGELRVRWKDITEVGSRSPVGPKARGGPVVGIRLSRVAPVQPRAATLRKLGLGGYDGYFDITIPPDYTQTPAEIVALMEPLRQRASAAPALDISRAATSRPAPPARDRAKARRRPPPPPRPTA
jgi:hypothetical protein